MGKIVLKEEASTPSTPSSTYGNLYIKSDGKAYLLDDSGSETDLTQSGKFGKFDAITAPGASNDNTESYEVGSLWVDVTADKAYVAVDVTTGMAIWSGIDFSSTDGDALYLRLDGTSTMTGDMNLGAYSIYDVGSLHDNMSSVSADINNRILYADDGISAAINYSNNGSMEGVIIPFLRVDSWINDSMNTFSIDPTNRELYFNDGSTLAMDWAGAEDSMANLSFDASNVFINTTLDMSGQSIVAAFDIDMGGYIKDGTVTNSIDPSNRYLIYNDGMTTSIDWQNGQMNESMGGTTTVDWNMQELSDNAGTTNVAWSTKQLSSSGTMVLDWSIGDLVDTSSFVSLSWMSRATYFTDGITTAIDWTGSENSSANLSFGSSDTYINTVLDMSGQDINDLNTINDNMGTTAVDIAMRTLADSMGSNVLDWSVQGLIDTSSFASIDWNARAAFFTDGSSYAIDWTGSENISANISFGSSDTFINTVLDMSGQDINDVNIINDAGGMAVVDVALRTVNDTAGGSVIDWSSGVPDFITLSTNAITTETLSDYVEMTINGMTYKVAIVS